MPPHHPLLFLCPFVPLADLPFAYSASFADYPLPILRLLWTVLFCLFCAFCGQFFFLLILRLLWTTFFAYFASFVDYSGSFAVEFAFAEVEFVEAEGLA